MQLEGVHMLHGLALGSVDGRKAVVALEKEMKVALKGALGLLVGSESGLDAVVKQEGIRMAKELLALVGGKASGGLEDAVGKTPPASVTPSSPEQLVAARLCRMHIPREALQAYAEHKVVMALVARAAAWELALEAGRDRIE